MDNTELNLNELSAFTNQNGGRKITMVESQTTLLTLPEGVDMSKVKGTAALDPSDIALDRGIYQFSYGGMPLGGTKGHYESLYLSVRNAINAVHKRFEPSREDTPEK